MIDYWLYRRAEIAEHLRSLAELRITVFREFPYLYEGSLSYEEEYLKFLPASSTSLLVLACHEERVVGASTALALKDEGPEFRLPFEQAGLPVEDHYYFGESILLPEYRGKGTGHRFFDLREGEARELGFRHACFCRVLRPDDHPLRPADYQPLDTFWIRRGFQRRPDLQTGYAWPDLGQTQDSVKPMEFWTKALEH